MLHAGKLWLSKTEKANPVQTLQLI